MKTVLARTGLSCSTVYRKIAEGIYPHQVKISVHGTGWRESAVNRCIDDLVAFRDEGAARLQRHRGLSQFVSGSTTPLA